MVASACARAGSFACSSAANRLGVKLSLANRSTLSSCLSSTARDGGLISRESRHWLSTSSSTLSCCLSSTAHGGGLISRESRHWLSTTNTLSCCLSSTAHGGSLIRRESLSTSSSSDQDEVAAAPHRATPGRTRVGWIGTGVMGVAMAEHVMAAGFDLCVYTRTMSKAEPLLAKGATRAETPFEVAQRSDVVISMVGYPKDVRQVLHGGASESGEPFGAIHGLAAGGVVVDMTTSEPSLARALAEEARARGCHSIDAPVSGGDVGAKNGALSIMAGGDMAAISAVRPVLDCMGTVRRLGGPGAGQSCKMANQVCIATTMVGLVEGLLYAHRSGLDVSEFLEAVRGGAAGSKSMELYAGRLLKRDMAPGFAVKHFVKDLGIALREAEEMKLGLPGLALAQQLYVSLEAKGRGDMGTQSLLLALEELNGAEIPMAATRDS